MQQEVTTESKIQHSQQSVHSRCEMHYILMTFLICWLFVFSTHFADYLQFNHGSITAVVVITNVKAQLHSHNSKQDLSRIRHLW